MPPQKPISVMMAVLLLGVAVAIDALVMLVYGVALIPIIGVLLAFILGLFLTIFGGVIFSAWFSYLNVKFLGKIGPTFVFEFIPILNGLPGWTLGVFVTIVSANGWWGKALGAVGLGTFASAIPGLGKIAQKGAPSKQSFLPERVPSQQSAELPVPQAANDDGPETQEKNLRGGREMPPAANGNEPASSPRVGDEIGPYTADKGPLRKAA